MMVRGIRGATVATANTREAILEATEELLSTIFKKNTLIEENIVSIFLSMTSDLNAEFPAVAARNIGLVHTPLLCLNEIEVPGSLKKCIRVLVHVNTETPQRDIENVYLREAISLRPDSQKESVSG